MCDSIHSFDHLVECTLLYILSISVFHSESRGSYLFNVLNDNCLKFISISQSFEVQFHKLGFGIIAHGAAH